jgi:hypothetical protein
VTSPPRIADDPALHAALKVLTVDGRQVTGIPGFVTPHLFPAFDLPEVIR